jgi:predicted dehydrogenase
VVDDRASTAAKFAGNDLTPYEGLKFLGEDELFATPGLQAVTVETPNADLVPTAWRCLERNLAMHMDKPGGETLAPFVRLRQGCEVRQVPFQMGYMFRGNPALQWCRQAARRGWLGEIFEIQGSMSHNYGGAAYQDYLGQFAGGIMFNLGCHLIDLVVAMMGRPEQVTPFLKSAPGWPELVKNNGLAILEYPHATATLRACSLDADGLARRRFRICGTKGVAELCPPERFDGQPLQMRLTLREGNEEYPAGTHTVDFGVMRDRYQAQLLELANIINGDAENPYSCAHDCLVQEVLLAAAGYTPWRPDNGTGEKSEPNEPLGSS